VSGGGEDQGFIGGFVVSGSEGSGAGGGHDLRGAIEEFDDVGGVKDVLIESAEKEDLVALERTADGASELLLAIVRLKSQESIGGSERTVAEVIKDGAVHMIGARLGDNVDDGAAGASLFGAVGIGGDAELLDNFGGDRVGSAITSASLGEESVVVIAAIDEGGVLESANAAEGEIAVRGRSQATRILGDAGREQGEVGEAAAVQGKIVDGTFVEQCGDGAGLSFDQGGRRGDGDIFLGAGDGEAIFEICGAADIDVELRRDLRRHALGYDASRVIAGRKQFEREAAFGVAGRGVAQAGRDVHNGDGSFGYTAAGGIDDGAADRSGSVLGRERCRDRDQKEDESGERNTRRRHRSPRSAG